MDDSSDIEVRDNQGPHIKARRRFDWIGYVIGVLGAAIGIYGIYDANKAPELTYYVSPTRTAIVQTNNLNNFSVTLGGTKINGNLSSAEITIWNKGKLPINGNDFDHGGAILRTICIKTPHGEPIYQMIATNSRSEIGFQWIATSNTIQPGIEPFTWKILENNDGVKIQLIYGGDVNLPILVDGAIVGQKGGIKETKIITNEESNQHEKYYGIATIIYFMILIPINIINEMRLKRFVTRHFRLIIFLALTISLLVFIGIAFDQFLYIPTTFPFKD